MIGISTLPDGNTPYADGMHICNPIVLYCADAGMDCDIDCDERIYLPELG